MNKFLKGSIKVTGFVLNKVALAIVNTLQVVVVGMSLFASWAAPRLVTLQQKLN